MRAAKPDPIKFCRMCGQQMHRRRFNGRLEDYTVFSRRIYCGSSCANRGLVKDAPLKQALLMRSWKFRGPCCESCGATTNLHCHHVDENRHNICAENIQTLCGRCHATHHHRARRAGQMVAGRMACRA